MRQSLQEIEAVIHLAAIVGDPACARQPALAVKVNQDASLAFLEYSQRTGVRRFIFASTCSNYGRMRDPYSYVDELSELRPISLYAETKVAVEKALLSSPGGERFCPTVLRFATVFGVSPRMRFDLTVNEFTMEMVAARRLVVFGEQFWRPYIHVRDVARGILMVLEAAEERVREEVFNVGSTKQNYQKKQLVEMIRPYAPDAVIEYVQKQDDPRDYRVSFEKVYKTLGFETTHTVEDGILEVVELHRSGMIHDYRAPAYRNVP
jgi:nucleoside-diphosphate-sugar epimerase